MRKIPYELDNPIDNFMLSYCGDPLMDRLYKLGVTPNMITTVGNVFRGLSVYFLYSGRKELFLILYVVGYYFDCLDGHFARRYNMCSKFGDFYDHISDTTFYFFLIYYVFFNSTLLESPYFTRVLTLFLIMGFLMFIHIGCQQTYYGSSGVEYMDVCKSICSNKDWLWWTRYFGCGTNIIFSASLAYIF